MKSLKEILKPYFFTLVLMAAPAMSQAVPIISVDFTDVENGTILSGNRVRVIIDTTFDLTVKVSDIDTTFGLLSYSVGVAMGSNLYLDDITFGDFGGTGNAAIGTTSPSEVQFFKFSQPGYVMHGTQDPLLVPSSFDLFTLTFRVPYTGGFGGIYISALDWENGIGDPISPTITSLLPGASGPGGTTLVALAQAKLPEPGTVLLFGIGLAGLLRRTASHVHSG